MQVFQSRGYKEQMLLRLRASLRTAQIFSGCVRRATIWAGQVPAQDKVAAAEASALNAVDEVTTGMIRDGMHAYPSDAVSGGAIA